MALRMFAVGIVAACTLVSLAGLAPSWAQVQNAEASPSAQIRQAERILIGTPEKDEDVAGGEAFLVEINEILRGAGTKGKLARIINSGDKQKHPRYKAGKRYVFLLEKNPAGAGWVNLSASEIPIEDDKVRFLADGKVKNSISLAAFGELAAGVDPARESLSGKWVLAMSDQGSDLHIWLVDVATDAKGVSKAVLVESAQDLIASSTLKESSIKGQDVRLVFLADSETFDFRGRFDKGTVRGSVMRDGRELLAARLLPTEAASLKKKAEPVATAGRNEFLEAVGTEAPFDGLLKFVQMHGDSPLALVAYENLIALSQSKGYKQDQVRKLAEDYQSAAGRWGPRFELKSLIDLGVLLSRADFHPQLALEYLNAAEKKLTDDTPESWKLAIRTETGRRLLRGDKPAEGLALLRKLHASNPFEEQITWLLARQAEQEKDTDAAIKLYGEIAGLPMLEGMLIESLSRGNQKLTRDEFPTRALTRLWTAKFGNTKGLSEYLVEVYEKSLHAVAAPKKSPRKEGEGSRVVLCELFTGSSCPPCVGADAATATLEMTYGQSEVIVLRYHQHIPAPDPLANDDSEERFSSYDGEGTPTLRVNGKNFAAPSGSMAKVPDIYRRLRETVEPYLTEKTALKLDLSARVEQSRIVASARALGLKTFPEDVHLKLVLAEDKVSFAAGNGIRVHEMIVRSMPAGVDGVEPEKGQLAWSGEIDLTRLKSDLSAAIAKIERKIGAEFDQKPLDMKALHLIAFLQNDETGEVLQAAAIPVSGTVTTAGETAKPTPTKTARSKAPVAGVK